MKTTIDLYFSGCGQFCGTREDYTSLEWEDMCSRDNLIIPEGTPRDQAYNRATALGHHAGEAWDLISTNSQP